MGNLLADLHLGFIDELRSNPSQPSRQTALSIATKNDLGALGNFSAIYRETGEHQKRRVQDQQPQLDDHCIATDCIVAVANIVQSLSARL